MKKRAAQRGTFAGHETFPFRYSWLPKAVAIVEKDGRVFQREDAMVDLGVGKNMVRAIRHWSLATGVVEEDPRPNNRGRILQVSKFGSALFGEKGWDPYIEDPATPWLLHWQLANRFDRATTWYWIFNHAPQSEFTKLELSGWLMSFVQQHGGNRVSEASLRRDIDVCLRTYCATSPTRTSPLEETLDCPLVELGLIRDGGGRGSFRMIRGAHPSLPSAVVAFAVAERLARREGSVRTVGMEEIGFGVGAPGRVFALTEDALLAHLERLAELTDGGLMFDETAGLRQILVKKPVAANDVIRAYYRSRTKRTSQRAANG